MMTLFFGDRAHPIYEVQGLLEIRKCKLFGQVVFRDHLPAGQPRGYLVQLVTLERGHSSPAGYTLLIGQIHDLSPHSRWEYPVLLRIYFSMRRNYFALVLLLAVLEN